MMNNRSVAKVLLILLWGLVASLTLQAQVQPPELAILDQIRYMPREELDALFQTATFLDDPQAVENLISYYLNTNIIDEENAVRAVLLYMTCQPERIIVERLHAETDPWNKLKLIVLLNDFYTEEVILTLFQQLDDIRLVVEPEDACPGCQEKPEPYRVCDRAYHAIFSMLEDMSLPDLAFLEPQAYASFDDMDALIAAMKLYWEQHNTSILEQLPMRPPWTILDIVTYEPKPQPPELVALKQVTALMMTEATRAEVDALFQGATFLDSTGAVSELLFRMKKVHTSEEINPIRIVLLYMTCSPEYIMLDCLESTNPRNPDGKQDSWSQVKLMNMLRDYYDPYIFQALLAQLEDTRPVTLPPEAPAGSLGLAENQRVCDYAYNVLFSQLKALEVPGYEALEPPPDASVEEMDTLISAMQQFWDEHEAAIVEAMNTRQPETLVDGLFGSAGP